MQMLDAILIESAAISHDFIPGDAWIKASAAALAYGAPDPIDATLFSGSRILPFPEIINVVTRFAAIIIASSCLRTLSRRQSLARPTLARSRSPENSSSFDSNLSSKAKASAAEPAKPASTESL